MDKLNVSIVYNGVSVDVEFNNKSNMLSGNSGTGKTFLMQAIDLYCINNNIKSLYIDYKFQGLDIEQLKSICMKSDVILLDNADLYVTNELIEWLSKNNKITIVCMKDTSDINMECISSYIVNYMNKHITIEEF